MTEPYSAALAVPTVKLSATKRNAIMRRGAWSQMSPVAHLAAQRVFYAKLMKRGPRQAEAYGTGIAPLDEAIKAVAAKP